MQYAYIKGVRSGLAQNVKISNTSLNTQELERLQDLR